MADFIDHINQAKHNLDCAIKFFTSTNCRDWAITATFYSAVHFAEAGFAITEIQHSEKIRPKDEELHTFRTRMVREKFGNKCWRSFRKLREASNNVRYLGFWLQSGREGTALNYYSPYDTKHFIENDIEIVRSEIQTQAGVDLS